MDSSSWRPAQAEQPPPMDGGDWRSQLQPDSRQRIVNEIMETLKRHLPFSGQEGLQELKQIAIIFEEKIYSAAKSQSDYLLKISLKMLTMESKSQSTLPDPMPSNSAGINRNPQDPASLDSAAQTSSTNVGDWQEEVYQKIKAMKDLYFADINEMYQKISIKLQQVLQITKNNILPSHREKLPSFEKQIVSLLNSNRPKKPVPSMQQGQIIPPQLQSMQQLHSQIPQAQSLDGGVNAQPQYVNF